MGMNLILKKMHVDNMEFVTADYIKKHCKRLDHDYDNTVRNLLAKGYLLRIFKGIFYVKTFDEIKMGTLKYSHRELVAKGLELKGVENWYFGLYSALMINNMTHEFFSIDYVLNDTIFRNKPMNINGYKFKFIKVKPELFGFGIEDNQIRYSDNEKTILDLIYIWKYNGKDDERIVLDLSEYAEDLSKKKIMKYSGHYPKSVRFVMERIL